MVDYRSTISNEKEKEIAQLTNDQAILKAVDDARIELDGLTPLEVYKTILDRINKSEYVID